MAGALRRGANGPIHDDAISNGPIELGSAAVTGAYEFDTEYVVHAAAMPHYGDGHATDVRLIAYGDDELRTVRYVLESAKNARLKAGKQSYSR